MIEPPRITETAAGPIAVIHLTVPRSKIRNVMGPGITEVMAAVRAQGISPAGPWFTHHLRIDPDVFDFEVGVPLPVPVAAVGRVKPGERPAMTVAQTIYHGPYEGLGEAWGQFDDWIAARGHRKAADLWECYAIGPESTPDPAGWRTELIRPLSR
jgi:effector-binding domain-containing protein